MTPSLKDKRPNRTSIVNFFRAIILVFRISLHNFDWQPILATVALSVLNVVCDFVTWQTYDVSATFADALAKHDYDLFIATIFVALRIAVLHVTLNTVIDALSVICGLLYRRNALEQAHKKYFGHSTYYRLNCIDNEHVDNPDQRITVDINNISEFCATDITPLTSSSITVGIFSYKVYQKTGWEGIAILYAVSLIGVLINLTFIKPLGKWINRIERGEGGFRYKHCTIRDNAEATAMYNAVQFENKECRRLYDKIIKKCAWLGCWEFPVQLIQAFFLECELLMCFVILFFPIIVHHEDIKNVMEFVTLNFFECHFLFRTIYTRLMCAADSVCNHAGVFRRVYEFFEFADKSWKEGIDDSVTLNSNIEYRHDMKDVFKFESVCYTTPSAPYKVLMKDLNLSMKRNENLLISGPSGCGKSAIFRIVTRLWKIKSGTLFMGISDYEMFVLPQKPYFPTGNLTLRQQIIFPKLIDDKEVLNEELAEFIKNLQLETVLEKCSGLDKPVDFEWHERFTLAELHQLSFIRVLYHQPKVVLMDDVSSCFTAPVEQRLYELLDSLGISYISTGNQVSLRAYHHKELKLHGDGTYEIVDLRDDPVV